MSLADFFDAMAPFLRGDTTVDELEAALGPSPSSRRDLELYPWLVDFGWVSALGELFPTLVVLADAREEDGWVTLARRFLRDHPPGHRELQRLGAPLADWLAAQPDLPPSWSCIADYRWTRWLARAAPDGGGHGLDERVFLRHYPLDVVEAVRAVHAHPGTELPPPLPEGLTIVIYRHARDRDVRTFSPTPLALSALARLGGYPIHGRLAGFSEEALRDERRRLARWGVIPEDLEEVR